MKRFIAIVYIIIGIVCGVEAVTYTNQYRSNSGSYVYATYETPSIQQSTYTGVRISSVNNVHGFSEQRIGYTSKYGGYAITTTSNKHTGDSRYQSNPGGGPRKSKERPDPDNDWRDLWRMNMPNILGGNSDWPSYVDDDYWEEFLAEYPEYATYAEQWFEEHGQHAPWLPDDPYPTPVNDSLVTLFLLCLLYAFFKNKRTSVAIYR